LAFLRGFAVRHGYAISRSAPTDNAFGGQRAAPLDPATGCRAERDGGGKSDTDWAIFG
jgi:hypothetical protein